MYLYLYRGENREKRGDGEAQLRRSDFSEALVRKALRDYTARQRLKIPHELLEQTAIVREQKGKPYFKGLSEASGNGMPPVHFSVSHSGDWWGCLMAEEPVGFDLEICREKVNFEQITRRFFTEEECEFVISAGQDAFFDVWVRKEAYVKYLGSGLAEGLDSFSVTENGKLSAMVITKDAGRERPSCYIRSCEIRDGIKAAYCCGSGNPVRAVISLE